jgi:hypothetical protein
VSTDPTATSGPTAPAPREPQPSVDRIENLAGRILTGDIVLPKFQRSFVWDRPQIISLLDSVARGFPIGSVLLWQSNEELRSENRIAGLDVDLPRAGYPVNYLLDGQQRLSTICGALYWTATDAKSRWNLAYDLRQRQFMHLDTLEDPPLHLIRMNKIPQASSFFGHVASLDTLNASDKDELKARAEALFNRFKDYKLATVTLGDMKIQDVAPIFERINSTGTALTIVDLMRAATWSPDFDLIDTIDELLEELASKGFSGIDKKVVLRNLSASAGGGFSTDSIDDLRKYSSDDLKTAADATKDSYLRTVDFLATQIKVPGADVIPYSNQLTVLAEVFRRLPSPSAAQYTAISEWFWRTALAGYFSGWNTGMMASDLAAVGAFAEGEASTIEVAAAKPAADIWVTRQFRANNAHAKLLAIVLAHHDPIDLLTGQRIDTEKALAWSNAKEYHHFFPRDYLKSQGVAPTKINVLANIVMLTSDSNKKITNRAPSDYLQEVEAAAGGNLETWLETNLISMDAFEAAKQNDYPQFLALRARTIHATVLPLAGWEPDEAATAEVELGPPSEADEAESEDREYTVEGSEAEAVAPEGAATAGSDEAAAVAAESAEAGGDSESPGADADASQ